MKRILFICLLVCFSLCLHAQESGEIKAVDLFDLMDQIDVINRNHGFWHRRKDNRIHRKIRCRIPGNTADSIFESDTIHILIDDEQGDEVYVVGAHNEYVIGRQDYYYCNFMDIDGVPELGERYILLSSVAKEKELYRGVPPSADRCYWCFHYELIKVSKGHFRYSFKTYLVDVFTNNAIPIPYHQNSVAFAYRMMSYYEEHPDEMIKDYESLIK